MINTTDTEDILKNLKSQVNSETDIGKAIVEFFKDEWGKDDNEDTHSVDLRSRLVGRAVRGHSVITFLQSIHPKELNKDLSLADGLDTLSVSMKRHVISLKGLSREELINLFKASVEANKPQTNFNLLAPK